MKIIETNSEMTQLVFRTNLPAKYNLTDNSKKMLKKLQLNEYVKEIEDLRKILVVTTGDNYVGAAEPQLREKIANLYGQVLSYAGKPTNAQLKNLDLLQGKLNEAKTKIKNLEAKAETINQLLEKNKIVGKISNGKVIGA